MDKKQRELDPQAQEWLREMYKDAYGNETVIDTCVSTYVGELRRKIAILYEAIEEIAFYGTSRPAEMGEDDGDGHYKKIAYRLISTAAIARRQCR